MHGTLPLHARSALRLTYTFSMPQLLNTLASPEQVALTPSRADGVPAALEEELRVYGCQLIQQAGILSKLYVLLLLG